MEPNNDIPKRTKTAKKRKAVANYSLFILHLSLMVALMLAVRTLVVSIHSVTGNGLAPLYQNGDQLLVNRCSYGLRIEGNALLPYSRLMRQPVKRGDIVAFTIPDSFRPTAAVPDGSPSGIVIARCMAIPGDTIRTSKGVLTVPGLKTCAEGDYYWLEAINRQNPIDSRHLGFIHEAHIVGRVVSVLYNRHHITLSR